jgi:hypothetical protein
MSHGIEVNTLPDGFQLIASTDNCAIAGFANVQKHYYGLQFHPVSCSPIALLSSAATTDESTPPESPSRTLLLPIWSFKFCTKSAIILSVVATQLGGQATSADKHEYGFAKVRAHNHSSLLNDIADEINYIKDYYLREA